MPQMVEIRKHPSFYPNRKIENKCFRDKMLACTLVYTHIIQNATENCIKDLYAKVVQWSGNGKENWYGAMHKFYITKHFLEHLLDL